MSRAQDLLALMRGVQCVAEAGAKLTEAEVRAIWKHSSIRSVVEDLPNLPNKAPDVSSITKTVTDSVGRVSTVYSGIREFARYSALSNNEAPTTAPGRNPSNIYANYNKEQVDKQAATSKKPYTIKLTKSDKELLKKLDREHRERMAKRTIKEAAVAVVIKEDETKIRQQDAADMFVNNLTDKTAGLSVNPNPKSQQALNKMAKQRTVPSTRLGRMVSFGSLAAGLGIGTLAEYTKRQFGLKDNENPTNIFLNKGNMERIVDTLCKVRGAALKIGQILSIQDESIVNPELAKALERVRKSADFMPTWQLEKVMVNELGDNWRMKFAEFDDKPFAAASIGQVHLGKLHDGTEVAVKIQYPGVAKGISSDIDNLIGIMKVWNIFPPGMFVDNLVVVAKRELAWEVDYIREAACTAKFKELLQPYPYYYVPSVIENLSTQQVFTTELIEGVPVDQCVDLSLQERKYIAAKAMELVLREIMEFQYMQTDPNWANFFYNPKTKKLLLLDFGATRAYSKKFTDHYVKIIRAASEGDRNTILAYSRELGFFTGYESKIMEEAHVEAVMVLGEVFRCPTEFDFSHQSTTAKIQQLVPTMLAHRLCPPPEEIYSLHRKISGVFLLCAKLKAPVAARKIFLELYENYKFDY